MSIFMGHTVLPNIANNGTKLPIVSCRKTSPSDLKLGFGSYVLSAGRPSPMAENEQRLTVGEIITHPGYAA